MRMTQISFENYRVEFAPCCGGFPSAMVLLLRGGEEQAILHTDRPWLRLTLGDGQTAVPVLPDDGAVHLRQSDDHVLLDFWNLPLRRESGELLPNWYLNLSYELNADGVGFLRLSFAALDLDLPDLTSLRLQIPMDLGGGEITYGYWHRLDSVDGTTIQMVGAYARDLTEKKPLDFGRTIVPLVGFDFSTQPGKVSRHIEWTMEGQNALGVDPYNTRSRLEWAGGNPVLTYEFADTPVSCGERPYQWRNQLGFVLGQTPKVRDKAPFRMYHWLDLYDRFPTDAQIRKMADEGADVLVIHEGWRTDLQGGGVPIQPERFAHLVELCHRLGIRILPYVRGNELSIREDQAEWFHFILRKNYDGLYADYGGAVDYLYQDDHYPGGRIGFKEYYRVLKNLREKTLGPDGLLLLHTGPFFCGAALCSIVDGYTSGEGEKGVMLASRREHAYFSESAIGPAALWTAAFPDYKTEKMLPYMANIGQMPHVSLGEQLKTSSLAHPQEPGCVTYARPLWKLYGLMKDERNLKFSNDQCDGRLLCDSDRTGAALFEMEDGAKLLILSNFREKPALCTVTTPLFQRQEGQECLRLRADADGTASTSHGGGLSLSLPAYGIGGWLLCPPDEKWQARLREFLRPYPPQDDADRAYLQGVEAMRIARFQPQPAKTQYLRVSIPTLSLGWEDAVWWDLYNSVYEFYVTPENGQRRLLGYIGRDGFTDEKPEGASLLWPGQETPWIALHELLPPGKSQVELRANHLGEDFYSFIQAQCAEEPCKPQRELRYLSELDPDRARLTFTVLLTK